MKKMIISILAILVAGCSYVPHLIILNSTDNDIEICNLGPSLKECANISKGKIGSIGLSTSNRSGYVFSASTEVENYSYFFELKSGNNYFSSIYCGKVFKHFCDIAVRFGESGIIYWSGRSSRHPTPDATPQPPGFPIKPSS